MEDLFEPCTVDSYFENRTIVVVDNLHGKLSKSALFEIDDRWNCSHG